MALGCSNTASNNICLFALVTSPVAYGMESVGGGLGIYIYILFFVEEVKQVGFVLKVPPFVTTGPSIRANVTNE